MNFIERKVEKLYVLKDAWAAVIKEFAENTYIRVYLAVLLVFNGCLWILANLVKQATGQDLIALHYQVDYGVNLIGGANNIFLLPAIGLIIIMVNVFLSLLVVRRKERNFLSHILLSAAVLTHFFIAIALWLLYLINYQ